MLKLGLLGLIIVPSRETSLTLANNIVVMTSFKITCYNVQGIHSSLFEDKTRNVDFVDIVNKSDILIALETWNKNGQEHYSLPNYREIYIPAIKHTNVKCGRSSGGIIVWFRESIKKYVHIERKGPSHIWIKLSKELTFSDHDTYLCALYIPPYESPYYSESTFENLKSEIIAFQSIGKILLMGDLNARTGNDLDFIYPAGLKYIETLQQNTIVSTYRHTFDNILNKHGKELLLICKDLGLYIVNGRTRGDSLGKFTYCSSLGSSVVDYAISDLDPSQINNFMVMPQLPLSDHSHITISLKKNPNVVQQKTTPALHPLPVKYAWNNDNLEQYITQLNSIQVEDMIYSFLFTKFENSRENINSAAEKITEILLTAAKRSLKKVKHSTTKKSKIKNSNKNKWFDKDCKKLRKELRLSSNNKHRNPANQEIRTQYLNTLQKYKSLLRHKKNDHMNAQLKEMEDALDHNSFWEHWNNFDKTRKEKVIPLVDGRKWTEHFEKLYKKDNLNSKQKTLESQLRKLEETQKDRLNQLDSTIKLSELNSKLKSLKNKKSCGIDGVYNQMLKHSTPKLREATLKLFNLILSSGHFPEQWKVSHITPIHKKGDKLNPNNYRGISQGSNLGKVFCGILTNRIQKCIQNNNIINSSQIGFSQNNRTTDHVYTLHTLIEEHVQNVKKGKIFGCFIDFSKAFDSVWHDGLMLKLIDSGIGGKTYDIIKDMYKNNRCCVKIHNRLTDYFDQTKGVRQGCCLSPTLFNIYINDLATKIERSSSPGLKLLNKEIKCLLFADDLLLLSPSPEALQESLNIINEYSITWALPINLDKSKIIVFQKRHSKHNNYYSFTIGEEKLEQVKKYCYLGLTISSTGLFDGAITDLTEKARKTYYMLRKSLLKYNPPIKLWLKLFDSILKPILLYGSEVWGTKFKNKLDTWDKSHPELFHLEFCKNILGVNRSCPNIACRAELGRYPLLLDIQKRAAKFWNHLQISKPDRHHHTAAQLRDGHPERDPFNYLVQKHGLSKKDLSIASKLKQLKESCIENYTNCWKNQMKESSKLNVYRTLKKDCKLAPYLIQIKNYKQRILLTKYRLSDHSLAVEKGRHRQCWVAPEGRLCVHCNINAVENEPHFLTECTKYHNIRSAYYKQFEYIHPGFINLTNQQKLPFLLGEIETCNILASEYVQSCHILREQAIPPINIGLNS